MEIATLAPLLVVVLFGALASGATLQSLRGRLDDMGFMSLWEDGLQKVAAGLTTPDEVLCATRL